MFTTLKRFRTVLLLIPLLAGIALGQDYVEADESYEPDARVARISVLVGDAKINRIESEDWETVVENLPVVEGDTIHTESNSKIEVQLDRYNYLHLDGNSTLKFVFLGDDGIALSLPQGTLGVRLIKFDFDKGYLEIDAPSSTVAIQKNGSYRIDAGDEFNREVRVSVRDDGQARVYSRDSGFVLKDGRTARLFLDGNLAGQWETARASTLLDGFDSWLQERNETIARLLGRDVDRDYYDDDIYGADVLDDYGRWTYTSNYGYLWRPHSTSIISYANWSPYRYGQWRWLPYYGWTWVNAEPWGWATYHYGRWIFYRGRWYWSPHNRYRRGHRAWWRPALVYFAYINNYYCWYPLPYGYDYYDYNRGYDRRRPRRRPDGKNRRRRADNPPPDTDRRRVSPKWDPPFDRVPEGGVVSTPGGTFGTFRNGFDRPPLGVARQALRRKPAGTNSPPLLPDLNELDRKSKRDFKAPPPRTKVHRVDTGAAKRKTAAALDKKLEREKIFGNRTPMVRTRKQETKRDETAPVRRTGAFERKREPKVSAPVVRTAPKRTTPIYRPRTKGSENRKTETRRKSNPTPSYVPKPRPPARKSSPPPRRSSPPARPSPPPTRSAPKRSEPRRSAPIRRTPKRSAPKKEAPKPSRKRDRKPKPGGELNQTLE